MNIAFFDFDGTITTRDTLFEFIRFCKGNIRFYLGIFINSPMIIAYKLGIIPNWKAKEYLLSYFFKGSPEDDILEKGRDFSKHVIPSIIRQEALNEIEKHKSKNTKIVVVTASFSIWIKPWCDSLNLELIATEYEVIKKVISGKIQGINCHGPEKVKRIKKRFDLKNFSLVYAYGDEKSDLPMLSLADIKYFKWNLLSC